jgi:hypothetical protein
MTPRQAGIARKILLFFFFFACVVLLQWRADAFQSELGADPDESAHYITGLMVRDYVAAGFPAPPLAYARNYYVHYPKVALGHWPPFFYVLQAAWTLAFSPSRISVMLLMAAITGLLATALCETLRKDFSPAVGVIAAVLFISLPAVEKYSHILMAEMPEALLVFLAILAYGCYLDTQRWQSAAWFSVWAALAMLTKGSAVQLALVIPFAVLFTRRWYLLGRFSFWLPAIVVGSIAGPWYLWVPGAQHEAVARFGGILFSPQRLMSTFTKWADMLGIVLVAAVAVGLFICCGQIRRGSAAGKWTAGVCVLAGVCVARLYVGAFEGRHLVVNLPVLVMFAAAGGDWLFRRSWWRMLAPALRTCLVALSLVVLLGLSVRSSPVKRNYGFSGAANSIVSHPEFKNSVLLVCSSDAGEGMLISEVAMRESRPGHIVLRASKMLSSNDWMGNDYRPLFHDQDEMLQYLADFPVGIVIIDGQGRRTPHGSLLYAGILSRPGEWELMTWLSGDHNAEAGDILAYRAIGHEGKPVRKFQIPMKLSLYGSFSN